MTQKDIKLLWGRAANRCSMCRIELSQDNAAASAPFTLGEQAHIVGENDGAARWKSTLDLSDRNSYHNIVLLCPNDHTLIDKNEDDWPVERLHVLKSKHELWVRETLGDVEDIRGLARQAAVAAIVDVAVELCELETWREWTSHILTGDPSMSSDTPDRVFEFRQRVATALWPDGFDELRRATSSLALILGLATSRFLEHAELDVQGRYRPNKFYRRGGRFNPDFDRDVERYQAWLRGVGDFIREATKAANWFADVVRRDLNPMFFAERGKFSVVEGLFSDFTYRASVVPHTL